MKDAARRNFGTFGRVVYSPMQHERLAGTPSANLIAIGVNVRELGGVQESQTTISGCDQKATTTLSVHANADIPSCRVHITTLE